MRNLTRFLSFILVVTLLATVRPPAAFAEANGLSYTEIVAPIYDDARGFSPSGLAAVKKGDKWGYINKSGEVVIDFQYDRAYSFSEGKALVEIHKQESLEETLRYYYLITPDNKATPLKYTDIDYTNMEFMGSTHWDMYDSYLYNGYILVPANTPSGMFVVDQYGESFDDAAFLPTEGKLAKYHHYSDVNRWVEHSEYGELYRDLGFVWARPFNQKMAPVSFEDPQDKRGTYWTFLKDDGTLWSGPKFYGYRVKDPQTVHQVFNEYSLASIENADGKWGAVNKEGATIIPFNYEKLSLFQEGLAAFMKNGKVGYIDIHKNEVIERQFDDASPFMNGLAAVRQGDNAYIIDKKGNKVKGSENIPASSYFRVEEESDEGEVYYVVQPPGEYILVQENNKYGFSKIQYTESNSKVTGVTLSDKEIELEEGSNFRLGVQVLPTDATNKNIHWSSSNDKVATIDVYGIVTAKSVGETTITATTEDGKHTATSKVIVKAVDPYKDYKVWSAPLKHNAVNYSWKVNLNLTVDKSTVNGSSVYIVDKNYKKLDFITAKVENNGNASAIILENKGSFKKGETYWIIVEDTVKSSDGKPINQGLKAQFSIN